MHRFSLSLGFAILFSLLFSMQALAQREVLPAGGDAQGGSGSFSWSIGQAADLHYSGSDGFISEGVQQPAEILPELVVYGPERQWIGDSGIPATDSNGKEILNHNKQVPYSVHYDRLPVYLLQIIKEQDKKIQELEMRLQKIEDKQ
jgi:hypothetical protein